MTIIRTPAGRSSRSRGVAHRSRARAVATSALLLFVVIGTEGCPAVLQAGISPDVDAVSGAVEPAAPGSQASVPILIVRKNGFTGAVTITATEIFGSIPTLTIPADQTTGTLLVTVPIGVASGTYSTLLSVTAIGIATKLAGAATVQVLAPANFVLSVSQSDEAQVLTIPSTGQVAISILRNNFTQPVTLTFDPTDQLPSGVTVQYAPAVVPGNSTQSAAQVVVTVNANISTDVLLGSSIGFTIHANSPGVAEQTQLVVLRVLPYMYTMGVQQATVQVIPGGTVLNGVTLVRVNSEAPTPLVNLAVTGPPGLTATAAPAQVPALDLSSVITITAAPSMAVGTYTMSVNGVAAGSSNVSATFAVQVTGPTYTLAAQTAPLNVTAGTSQPDNIIITRPAFNGPVTVTGTSDQGIAISSPAATSGNQVGITVSVPASASVGTHTVTLKGVAAGLTDVAGSFALVVTAPQANNTTWTFCPTVGLPLWVAVQDGNAAWTQVAGASNAYPFAISSARGGVAYAVLNGGTTELHVLYATQAELQSQGGALCPAGSGATKSISGLLTNTGTGTAMIAGLGSSTAFAQLHATTTFNLSAVPPGPLDLVVATMDGALPANPFQMAVQRNVNAASTLGLIDFATAFTPAQSTLTLGNTTGEQIKATYQLHSASGALATYYVSFTTSPGATLPLFGLPAAQQVAGDLHFAVAQSSGSSVNRSAGVVFATVASKLLNFGSALSSASVSVLATTPYARLQAVLGTQAEYGKLFEADFLQTSTGTRSAIIQMTGGYAGGTGATLGIPDFTAVGGWLNSYGLQAGVSTDWYVTAATWSAGGGIVSTPMVDGATFSSATKSGNITP